MHHPSPVKKNQFSAFLNGQPVRSVAGAFQGSKENVCSDLKAGAVGRDVSVAQWQGCSLQQTFVSVQEVLMWLPVITDTIV